MNAPLEYEYGQQLDRSSSSQQPWIHTACSSSTGIIPYGNTVKLYSSVKRKILDYKKNGTVSVCYRFRKNRCCCCGADAPTRFLGCVVVGVWGARRGGSASRIYGNGVTNLGCDRVLTCIEAVQSRGREPGIHNTIGAFLLLIGL